MPAITLPRAEALKTDMKTLKTAETDTKMSAKCPLFRPKYLRHLAAKPEFKRITRRKIRACDACPDTTDIERAALSRETPATHGQETPKTVSCGLRHISCYSLPRNW
jgi:hypothetical protein